MQRPKEVLDSYYLEARCQLLEIAAMLDRYDRARVDNPATADDKRVDLMYQSLALLSRRDNGTNRSERLLNLFSDPE